MKYEFKKEIKQPETLKVENDLSMSLTTEQSPSRKINEIGKEKLTTIKKLKQDMNFVDVSQENLDFKEILMKRIIYPKWVKFKDK